MRVALATLLLLVLCTSADAQYARRGRGGWNGGQYYGNSNYGTQVYVYPQNQYGNYYGGGYGGYGYGGYGYGNYFPQQGAPRAYYRQQYQTNYGGVGWNSNW